ncbi:hypothetical protein LN042_29220 [Kitasatospora sp. RB6PN24]|uniref:hypothetical protein n=1 Tax=Kitasatospora humi TaxID=2893891 RepID=UPI001E2B0B46|nr:hypothetical protein [Kitasatospora humi]MCC9311098.1 hypothetical protein [Kitasatospora humi]
MSTAPVRGHHDDRQPIARTQYGVAAALPPAQRVEFYQEMGEGPSDETIGGPATGALVAAGRAVPGPGGDRIHADIQAGNGRSRRRR